MFRTFFAFCLMLALLPVSAGAAESKFAYVDVTRILSSADAADEARSSLKKKLATKQKEISAMEEELKTLKEKLDKQKSFMNADAQMELKENISRKYRAYQRFMEDNQAVLDRESGRWNKRIMSALGEVIQEIGKEAGYTVVFGKGQVLYHSPSIDITDTVLKRLNQRTKKGF
ncbi:MAG: OmpH family outer membrane protein [Magnetococcales bacterium]|nr:OmpH family outer membrane protein [Magnetococcales bacterium]